MYVLYDMFVCLFYLQSCFCIWAFFVLNMHYVVGQKPEYILYCKMCAATVHLFSLSEQNNS